MISRLKEVLDKLEFGFLELFMGFFMLIGLIGYFGSLSADLDWLDHTVAFIMFTYFFYILDVSSILFGKKSRLTNALIAISCLSIFFKDIIRYTEANAFKFRIFTFVDPFYVFLRDNLFAVTIASFYIGLLGLFIASVYLARKIEISHPSFAHAIFGRPVENKILKFLLIFVLLLAFYYLIYNPILEWLEFVLDDPIIAIGAVFYIVKIAKHREKFRTNEIVFKIGDLVWSWYSRFISLFHYRKTIPLAISGILILHSVSELGVFAYSLIFGKQNFYLEFLKGNHEPFYLMFLNEAGNLDLSVAGFALFAYFLNALSLVILLSIPVIVWIKMFSQKELHLHNSYLFFIYASFAMHIFLPAYTIFPINEPGLTGVDIMPVSVFHSSSLLENIFPDRETVIVASSVISIFFGLLVYLLAQKEKINKELYSLAIISGLTFYAVYIYYFFATLFSNILNSMEILAFSGHYPIVVALAVYLLLGALFYILGFLLFVYEIVMEYHRRKWSDPIDEEIVFVIQGIQRTKKRLFSKKAQIPQEILKYAIVSVIAVVVIIAGYKSISAIRERACQTEISTFEINLKGIDKELRPGTREQRTFNAPCGVDEIYFFDMSKDIDQSLFSSSPVLMDSVASKSYQNVFLVKENEVKRSFYAGNVESSFPYHICFKPKFGKISFFAEGMGEKVKITGACEQPECTLIPVNISEDDARRIIAEAVYDSSNSCDECMYDYDLQNIRLTREKVEMFRRFSVCNGITRVEIVLRPKEPLQNVRHYEFIPKECVDDLSAYLEGNPSFNDKIILQKNDPLIVWNFDELDEETILKYNLKEIGEECEDIIQSFVVSKFVEGETAPRPCYGTANDCGTPGNCAACGSGQVCQNNACTDEPKCPDGTTKNSCSTANHGKYCDNSYNLVNGCSSYSCGCPVGRNCENNACVLAAAAAQGCAGGIPLGCHTNPALRPLKCVALGNNQYGFVNDCDECDCPPGWNCEGNGNCGAPGTSNKCSDGTQKGACSLNQPYECKSNLVLLPNAGRCGCPSGYRRQNDNCVVDNSGCNQCTLGSRQCSGIDYQECVDNNGCTEWSANIVCGGGQTCQGAGICQSQVNNLDHFDCNQKNVWWYNSNNQPYTLYKNCQSERCVAFGPKKECRVEDGEAKCCCGWASFICEDNDCTAECTIDEKRCQSGVTNTVEECQSVDNCPTWVPRSCGSQTCDEGECTTGGGGEAELSVSVSCGPNCNPSCGASAQSGNSWYYYSTSVTETNGVSINLNRKCRSWQPCGSLPGGSNCISINVNLPANGQADLSGSLNTGCGPRDFTETIEGTDSNGNTVSKSHSFTLNGC